MQSSIGLNVSLGGTNEADAQLVQHLNAHQTSQQDAGHFSQQLVSESSQRVGNQSGQHHAHQPNQQRGAASIQQVAVQSSQHVAGQSSQQEGPLSSSAQTSMSSQHCTAPSHYQGAQKRQEGGAWGNESLDSEHTMPTRHAHRAGFSSLQEEHDFEGLSVCSEDFTEAEPLQPAGLMHGQLPIDATVFERIRWYGVQHHACVCMHALYCVGHNEQTSTRAVCMVPCNEQCV